MLAKSLEKMGVSYRLWRWASVICYMYIFSLRCGLWFCCNLFYQTNFSLRVSSSFGGSREKSRESTTLARSLAIRGEFASRLTELE